MALLVCWVVFPLVLALLSLGCGLLLERVVGPLRGALLVPVGLAGVIVVAAIVTAWGATARAATPVVVVLAFAGFVLSRRRTEQLEWWPVGVAVAVFAVYAAPVVLSGQATFAGYITLDDTASFLAMTDRVMDHGRDLAGLAPSTYQRVLDVNLAHGYPLGSFLPLGVGHKLLLQDSAWLFQPYLAFLGAALSLCLWSLARPFFRSSWVRGLAVFVAAQPALLYGYSLWSGVKELAAAVLVALAAALVAERGLIALAVVAAATLDVLSPAGAIWLLPAALAVAVATLRRSSNTVSQSAGTVRSACPGASNTVLLSAFATFGVLATPAWLTVGQFLRGGNRDVLTSGSELGNLAHALSPLQLFGIWPAGDFRFDPSHAALAYLLVALAILASVGGFALAAVRRAPGPLVYAASAALGCAVFAGVGSPWLGAKAFATASPALLLLAAIGIAAIPSPLAAVVAMLIAGGVLWSNVLAYRDVWLAPRGQLAELEGIGKRFAGDGPALMTEFQPYGARHFLRSLEAEGASELRVRPVYLSNGTILEKAQYADLDRFQIASVLVYRTLVLRRSPSESRPPSVFNLVYRGQYYEVWQRPPKVTATIDHLALGDSLQPGAIPRCSDVLALARKGPLVAAPRAAVTILGSIVEPATETNFKGTFDSAGGPHELWVGGSWRGDLHAAIDGKHVGEARAVLNNIGQWQQLGTVQLAAGKHELLLHYSGPDLHPGSDGTPFPLGPVAVSSDTDDPLLIRVPAARARSLCGRRLDWVEAVR